MAGELSTIDEAISSASRRYRHAAAFPDLKWAQEREHLNTLLARFPKLKQCTPDSLCNAILEAASMGLSFNPGRGHCYLIPRAIKKDSPIHIAYPSPSYRGLVSLAVTSNMIKYAVAEVIFAADFYDDHGPVEKPTHNVATGRDASRTEGDAVGVYALARLPDGDWIRELMDRPAVLKCRWQSDFPNGLMWNPEKHWTEGWRKTCLRRASKHWPQPSGAFEFAIDTMNRHEGIIIDGQTTTPPTGDPVAECLTQAQIESLHDVLKPIPKHHRPKWLGRLAKRYGVNAIAELTDDDYMQAKATLRDAVENHVQNKNQTDAAG